MSDLGEPNPFEHLDLPRKGEITISEINNRINARMRESRETKKVWSYEDIRDQFRAEANYGDLSIRGPIQVAKGQEPILGVNYQQYNAIRALFGAPETYQLNTIPLYAAVQTTGREEPETVDAIVKVVSALKPRTENHLVVSEGLANVLRANDQNEIRITGVFQNPEDIDLDKL